MTVWKRSTERVRTIGFLDFALLNARADIRVNTSVVMGCVYDWKNWFIAVLVGQYGDDMFKDKECTSKRELWRPQNRLFHCRKCNTDEVVRRNEGSYEPVYSCLKSR